MFKYPDMLLYPSPSFSTTELNEGKFNDIHVQE